MGVGNILDIWEQSDKVERGEGMRWYLASHVEAHLIQRDNLNIRHFPIEVVCGVLAACSPGKDWYQNMSLARLTLMYGGIGVQGLTQQTITKCRRILDGEDVCKVLRGPKTCAFYHCILDPCDSQWVCVDTHAKAIWENRRIKVRTKDAEVSRELYAEIAEGYREAAKQVGVLPNQIQAVTWWTWKRIHRIGIGPQMKFRFEGKPWA